MADGDEAINDPMEGVDGGDDTNSDDSSFEEVEISDGDIKIITDLEKQLKNNPNTYDTHIQVRLVNYFVRRRHD